MTKQALRLAQGYIAGGNKITMQKKHGNVFLAVPTEKTLWIFTKDVDTLPGGYVSIVKHQGIWRARYDQNN